MTVLTDTPSRIPTGPRWHHEPELFGAYEAAETLGVSQPNLRTVKDLPEPYGKIKSTTLWRAEEVRLLAQRRNARLAKSRMARAA